MSAVRCPASTFLVPERQLGSCSPGGPSARPVAHRGVVAKAGSNVWHSHYLQDAQQQQQQQQHAMSGVPVELLRKAIEARCVPLGKLRMLMDVLDAPMKQIVSLWERRDMQVVGFNASEVEHLLMALFEQSQHMRSAIARIRAVAS